MHLPDERRHGDGQERADQREGDRQLERREAAALGLGSRAGETSPPVFSTLQASSTLRPSRRRAIPRYKGAGWASAARPSSAQAGSSARTSCAASRRAARRAAHRARAGRRGPRRRAGAGRGSATIRRACRGSTPSSTSRRAPIASRRRPVGAAHREPRASGAFDAHDGRSARAAVRARQHGRGLRISGAPPGHRGAPVRARAPRTPPTRVEAEMRARRVRAGPRLAARHRASRARLRSGRHKTGSSSGSPPMIRAGTYRVVGDGDERAASRARRRRRRGIVARGHATRGCGRPLHPRRPPDDDARRALRPRRSGRRPAAAQRGASRRASRARWRRSSTSRRIGASPSRRGRRRSITPSSTR